MTQKYCVVEAWRWHDELGRFQCHLLATEKTNTWSVLFSSSRSGEVPNDVLTVRGNSREPPWKARTKIKKRKKSGRGACKQWLLLPKRLVWMLRRQQFYQSWTVLFVWKKGKQSIRTEVIFYVEKHFQEVLTRVSWTTAVQRVMSLCHRQLSLPGCKKTSIYFFLASISNCSLNGLLPQNARGDCSRLGK